MSAKTSPSFDADACVFWSSLLLCLIAACL